MFEFFKPPSLKWPDEETEKKTGFITQKYRPIGVKVVSLNSDEDSMDKGKVKEV